MRWQVFCHDGSGSDDASFPDGYSTQNLYTSAKPAISSNAGWKENVRRRPDALAWLWHSVVG